MGEIPNVFTNKPRRIYSLCHSRLRTNMGKPPILSKKNPGLRRLSTTPLVYFPRIQYQLGSEKKPAWINLLFRVEAFDKAMY